MRELDMENVFFGSSLICLLVMATVSASFSCSESINNSHSTEIRSTKEMKFNFEDYDIKSTEVVREKLSQLFPKGSSLNELQGFLEGSGSEFHSYKDDNSMHCYLLANTNHPLVKNQWIISVKIENGSVGDITVKAAIMAA
jgi:hypothetical protein